MPIYDFKCLDCGLNFETISNLNKNIKCTKCNSENIKKIISSPRFILKGENWAKDNYGLIKNEK